MSPNERTGQRSGANDPGQSGKQDVNPYLLDPLETLPAYVENKHKAVKSTKGFTLEQVEQLMINVQHMQRNMTESLNQASRYRKTVAGLLENLRRERANARRAQGKQGEGLPPATPVQNPLLGDFEPE